jgi:hypothetical protein
MTIKTAMPVMIPAGITTREEAKIVVDTREEAVVEAMTITEASTALKGQEHPMTINGVVKITEMMTEGGKETTARVIKVPQKLMDMSQTPQLKMELPRVDSRRRGLTTPQLLHFRKISMS